MNRPLPSSRSCWALLGLLAAPACINTFESREGPTDEQLFELYVTTATYLYEDDSLIRAQDQAVKALEIEPDDLPMRRMVGWIRLRMGTNEDLIIAEEFFRELVAEGDLNEATLLGLATSQERLGSAYDQAAEDYLSGEREPADGGDPEAMARSLASRSRDYWHEAIRLYEQVLTDGEGSTTAMNGMQRVHALLGDYEASLQWSERLLTRTADELDVWRRMLTSQEMTESEEDLYRENKRIAIDLQTETHLFAASVLHTEGRDEEAIVHLDLVVELQPELPQSYSRRAQLLILLGRYEQAIADLDRYLSLSDEPFESEDVQRAFELRTTCEQELASPTAQR